MLWKEICKNGLNKTEVMEIPGGCLICRTDGALSPRNITMVYVPGGSLEDFDLPENKK